MTHILFDPNTCAKIKWPQTKKVMTPHKQTVRIFLTAHAIIHRPYSLRCALTGDIKTVPLSLLGISEKI